MSNEKELTTHTTNSPVSYEYLTVETGQNAALETVDCYKALGWELANKNDSLGGNIFLNFKRNRKVKNRDQLNRLQFKVDDGINSIRVLEKRKTKNAMIVSLVIGIIGTLIFGAGLSLWIGFSDPQVWMYVVGSVLAVVGAVPCSLAYFAYAKIRSKDTVKMNSLIDQKRDEISMLLEEAQRVR